MSDEDAQEEFKEDGAYIHLGGKHIRVVRDNLKIAEEGARQGNTLHGFYDEDALTVYLTENDNLHIDQLKDTTVHELVHHVINESPLRAILTRDDNLGEDVCLIMAPFLLELIRRNWDFILWLRSEAADG